MPTKHSSLNLRPVNTEVNSTITPLLFDTVVNPVIYFRQHILC